MNIGWDNRGFARKTGVPEIDAMLGRGDLQDAQDCNYSPRAALDQLGVDGAHGAPDDQYEAGLIWLKSGAVLERGQSMASVWACTRLPDSHREPCNQSCRCCQTGTGGYCEGQSTCPEHCPMSMDVAPEGVTLAQSRGAVKAAEGEVWTARQAWREARDRLAPALRERRLDELAAAIASPAAPKL